MDREGSFSVIIFVFFSINGVTQLFFNVEFRVFRVQEIMLNLLTVRDIQLDKC